MVKIRKPKSKPWSSLKKFAPIPVGFKYVFKSGKYVDFSVKDVLQINPQYLLWVHNHSTNLRFNNDVLRRINKVPKHKRLWLVGDEDLFSNDYDEEDWATRDSYWDLEGALFD